jgi:NADP-dependent 3-hydroxy acid dehydrogenase YdfG
VRSATCAIVNPSATRTPQLRLDLERTLALSFGRVTTKNTILITGGSSGIGFATAQLMNERGDAVVITGRSQERLDACLDRLGRPDRLIALSGDAADPTTVQEWVRATVEQFGGLTAAIANAGYATAGSIGDGDPAQWQAMILTNVLGPALLMHYALPSLRTTRGRVILIGSTAGLSPTPGNLYSATKYAVTGLAENARRMLTDDGVGVTLLAPGRVDTEFWTDVGGVPDLPNLSAKDVAEVIAFTLDRPVGVELGSLTLRPPRSPV